MGSDKLTDQEPPLHIESSPFFRKVDWSAFWTTFGVSFAAYFYTIAPTVTLEDSGELAVASDYLGVPHPPGYPIWTLLTWFFQWIFHWVRYYGQPDSNLMLVVINLPLVGLWVRLLRVPYRLLFPMILVFCCIGVYSLNNTPFDIVLTAGFAILGYWLLKHGFEPAPMLLGFVLGPLMEENLRRAMLLSRGDPMVFLERPISLGLIITTCLLLVLMAIPSFKKAREEAFVEEEG